MKIVDDFFNKLVKELDNKYFPSVKFFRDDKNDTKLHYAVELFNNGIITYDKLIDKISVCSKETKQNIHLIVSKYIKDFENYSGNYSLKK